jgi:hypothetical protein
VNIPPEMLQLAVATIAGFVFGLYVGERGRRKDAQRREGIIRVDDAPRARVRAPGQYAAEGRDREIMEPDESFIAQTIAETGCSREEAIKEWRTLLGKALGDGGGSGWMQEGGLG